MFLFITVAGQNYPNYTEKFHFKDNTYIINIAFYPQTGYVIQLSDFNNQDFQYSIKYFYKEDFVEGFAETIAKFYTDTTFQQKDSTAARNIAEKKLFYPFYVHFTTPALESRPIAGYLFLNDDINLDNEDMLIERVLDLVSLKKTFLITEPYKDSLDHELQTLISKIKDTKEIQKLKDRYKCFKNEIDDYDFVFKVDSASLEFVNGNIKNIIVIGILTIRFKFKTKTIIEPLVNKMIMFNAVPIGFSTMHDYSALKQIMLYYKDYFGIKFPVIDLMNYIPNLQLNSEDYSPENKIYKIQPDEKAVILYKEKTVDILKAEIYSDFMGFGQDNPNGLIQTEVSRKFFLYSKRIPREIRPGRLLNRNEKISIKIDKLRITDPTNSKIDSLEKKSKYLKEKSYFVKSGQSFKRIISFGFLNFIEPKFIFSKLEDNNKYLPVTYDKIKNQETGKDSTIKYVTTIDLLSHVNMSIGGKINLLVLDFPVLKSSLFFNMGGYYQLASIIDSTATFKDSILTINENKFNVGLMQSFWEAQWMIKTDARFSISLYYRLIYLNMLTEKFQLEQIDNNQKTRDFEADRWLQSIQLLASIKLSDKSSGRLFFRGTLTYESSNMNNNYFQAQLGYSFNILQKK